VDGRPRPRVSDHRLADPELLAAMLKAGERAVAARVWPKDQKTVDRLEHEIEQASPPVPQRLPPRDAEP
jgi:hypothetical protein